MSEVKKNAPILKPKPVRAKDGIIDGQLNVLDSPFKSPTPLSEEELCAWNVWNAVQSSHITQEEKDLLNQTLMKYKQGLASAQHLLDTVRSFAEEGTKRESSHTKLRKGSFKMGGHAVDMMLANTKPGGVTMFDSLKDLDLKNSILPEARNIEGIKLTVVEDRLLNAICALLDKNLQAKTLTFYQNSPVLDVPLYSLYEAVGMSKIAKARQEDYSGGDVETIKKAIDSLSRRTFLIRYKRQETNNKKDITYQVIESYQSLISTIKIYDGLTPEEAAAHMRDGITNDNKGRITMRLNPILIDQIDTKFILMPNDINSRIILANGGAKRYSTCVNLFIKYILRDIGANGKKGEAETEVKIKYSTLVHTLQLSKELTDGRRKRIEERFAECFRITSNMNLLLNTRIDVSADGSEKLYVFTINPEYLNVSTDNL